MIDEPLAPAPAEPAPVAESPAPEAPQESPAPSETRSEPVSRSDAIKRAFDKVSEGDEPVGEAKAEPKQEGDGPARGPDGKFVARDGEPKSQDGQQGAEKAPETAETKPQGKTPLSEPPARFSADAKAAWKEAPEALRGEMRRAIGELERGIAAKDETLRPLKPFMDMAQQSNVQLHEVMQNYVRMEQTLARDPRAGIEAIANNFGMTFDQFLGQLTGQQPEQGKDAHDREILALWQENQRLEQRLNGLDQNFNQQREQSVMSDVQRFAAEHPRFDELAPEIARLIETGYASDLSDAYEKAERLNPAPAQAAPPPPPAASAQTRQRQSVTGAPGSGSNPAFRPSTNRSEAIQRAFQRSGL